MLFFFFILISLITNFFQNDQIFSFTEIFEFIYVMYTFYLGIKINNLNCHFF